MKKTIFLFAAFSLIFSSCSKESILEREATALQQSLPNVIQILDLIQKPTNGYIRLQSQEYWASRGSGEYVFCMGDIYDQSGSLADYGILTIGDAVSLSADSDNSFSYGHTSGPFTAAAAYYGTEVDIHLEGNANGEGSMSASLYVPELLTWISPDTSARWGTDISSGFELKWNPDANNEFGIGIIVEFDNWATANIDFEDFPKVEKTIHTEDDGSYILTGGDFDGIPAGARLKIYIGRGNYERKDASGNRTYGVYAYTINSFIANYTP